MKNRYYQCSIISGSRKQEPNGEVKVASRLSTQFYPNLDTDNDSIIDNPGYYKLYEQIFNDISKIL